MRFDDCTPEDQIILTAIVALATGLQGEFPLYSQAIGELRRKFYGRGRTRGRTWRGAGSPHREVRVREKYGVKL